MQRRLRSAVPSRLAVLTVLVAFVTVPNAWRASAQVDDRLAGNRKQQMETTAEIDATNAELTEIRSQRQEIELSVKQIAGELTSASERLVQAQADSDRYAVVSLILGIQIDKTQEKLDEARAATRQSAVLLYQRSDSSAMLDLMGSADGSGDFVEGSQYLKRISNKRHGDARRVGALRAELATQESKLDESRKLTDTARDEAVVEQRRLDDLYGQREQALANAQNAERSFIAKRAELGAMQAQLTSEFQAISDEIAASLANQPDTPSYGTGQFISPVGKVPIASPFGYRTDPITGEQAFHAGVDFAASCGTPIKAADSGVIFFAGPNGGYGNATIVNHGAGLATLYAHQSAIAVSVVGQVVERGQVIGYVGSTGKSTGCHLHFEVRVNGTPVNPMGYL
ncbi:MAG: peptidoglycan DD-metalloendopeptidase family protein [Acidimicrobiia bacterium]